MFRSARSAVTSAEISGESLILFPQITQIGTQMNADFWFCEISVIIRENLREVFDFSRR